MRRTAISHPGPEPKDSLLAMGLLWTGRRDHRFKSAGTWTSKRSLTSIFWDPRRIQEFRAASATKKHQVHFDELKPDAEYRFRIHGPSEGIMLNSAASTPLTVLFIMRRLSYVRQPKLPLLPSPTSR